LVHEPGIIVVVNEDAESIDILEMGLLLLDSILDAIHGFTTTINVLDGIVHRVVEKTSQGTLIRSNLGGITIEVLSHLEDTSGLSILSPEIHGNLRDGVNSNTIKVVGLDKIFDPVLKLLSYPAILLVQIGKVSQSAEFNLVFVIPVVDLAFVMIMLIGIERSDSREVHIDRTDVVGYDIHHHPNVLVMSSFHKILEILLATKVRIEFVPVGGPVSMITLVDIVYHRRYPDSVETHSGDIIKVLLYTLVSTTTIVGEITTGTIIGAVALRESISEDLINGSLFPSVGITSGDASN
jgi:hypothetical protein